MKKIVAKMKRRSPVAPFLVTRCRYTRNIIIFMNSLGGALECLIVGMHHVAGHMPGFPLLESAF